MALLELKRPEEALGSCDKALAIEPNSVEALTNRGNVLFALKRLEEALASHDKALAIKPNHTEVHNNCGSALLELKQPEQALASFWTRPSRSSPTTPRRSRFAATP